MKVRDSGMPEEEYWESLFDVQAVLDQLGPLPGTRDALDFGAGYGTFALPVARQISGTLYALDLDHESLARLDERARLMGLANIRAEPCDFVRDGTGRPDAGIDYVMLFNILHHCDPETLVREAARILAPGGRLAAIHWRSDIPTPRGPELTIRPRPEQVRAWLENAGFLVDQSGPALPGSYHFGFTATRVR